MRSMESTALGTMWATQTFSWTRSVSTSPNPRVSLSVSLIQESTFYVNLCKHPLCIYISVLIKCFSAVTVIKVILIALSNVLGNYMQQCAHLSSPFP